MGYCDMDNIKNKNNNTSNGIRKGILLFLLIVFFVFAGIRIVSAFSLSPLSSLTMPFAGRIILTQIPGVVCTGIGTGPIVLLSTFKKGTVYDKIPFFATDMMKIPTMGGIIMGKAEIVPDFSTCQLMTEPPIPFPVRKTSYYGVSLY